MVPASPATPVVAKRTGPERESSASCAKVSTFDAKVGRRCSPEMPGCTRRPGGTGAEPESSASIARTSPPTKPAVERLTRTRAASERSAIAEASEAALPSSCTDTTTSLESIAAATARAPSSTRCGARRISVRSLRLAGSLSLPLTTTAEPSGTPASLLATGKPAPPRPRNPTARHQSVSVVRACNAGWPRAATCDRWSSRPSSPTPVSSRGAPIDQTSVSCAARAAIRVIGHRPAPAVPTRRPAAAGACSVVPPLRPPRRRPRRRPTRAPTAGPSRCRRGSRAAPRSPRRRKR